MDKSKTRGGQAPFPETPALAGLTGVIYKAVETFYDRLRGQSETAFATLAAVAGLRQWGNESHWDADFIRAHVPEGPLRNGLLEALAAIEWYDEQLGLAYHECEALRQWHTARQAQQKAREAKEAAGDNTARS